MKISKKKAINILEEIYQMAHHATLTGALADGGKPLVATYNKIRELSVINKWVEKDLIEVMPIVTDGEMANVGTASRLLAKILEDEEVIEAFECAETEEVKEYDENGYEIKDNPYGNNN